MEENFSISNKIDWFDLVAVQGTLKSLLQNNSSKASVLWCSAFCMVQLSLPYMTTGKTIALTRWTFVGKLMSLLFNILSKLKWSEVKSLNRVRLFATPWTVAYQASLCPWDFPGNSTGVDCHFLLQRIFPTQGSNPGLLHCRQMLYGLSHQERFFFQGASIF